MCYLNGGPCECTSKEEYAEELTPVYKLESMLDMQKALQKRLGADFDDMTTQERVAFIKEHSIHLNQEVNEMLYELPYFKPWKNYRGLTPSMENEMLEKARMELIDAWHFFMNMALALGMTSEQFYMMYNAKNKENHRRQDEGYTADKSYRNQSVEEVLGNG
jgi:dimeric dUTPase (all-alpha-NTP-PPase superfamily)